MHMYILFILSKHIKLIMHHLCVHLYVPGAHNHMCLHLRLCTFIMRECALLSSGLSIYEETYTVQL